MEHQTILLKENSSKIRNKIKNAGIHVCVCASFTNACWLDYHTSIANGVHGVGYWNDDRGIHSQEEELARFLREANNIVVCQDVDEFIERILDSLCCR